MYQQRLSLFNESFVKGIFQRQIFYNPENGYGVYAFYVEECSEPLDERDITVVGHVGTVQEGVIYACYGEWRTHPRYGLQFYVSRIKQELPHSEAAVVKYLSSSLFPGIGPKTAKTIVNYLGEGALQKIAQDPDVLRGIPSLSDRRAALIAEKLQEHQNFEQVMLFLYDYGIGSALAFKIYQTYGQETLNVLKENPYQLIHDVEGVGFARADAIGRAVGIGDDAPERKKAAVLYALNEAAHGEGHVYLTEEELKREVVQLLGVGDPDDDWLSSLRLFLVEMSEEGQIVLEDNCVYLPSLYYSERGIAKKVRQLLLQEKEVYRVDELYRLIGELEDAFSIVFAEEQREALVTAVTEPVVVLTGGPGTGKTTVIRGICHLLAKLEGFSLAPVDEQDKSYPVHLVAPTGRAAKRMSEATGLPAMTIHRLLGWRGEFFEHDADNPISGRLLIVDEASMVDVWLAYQLLRAVPEGMKVVFVGDAEQLPSVGPGQVFHHLIVSGQLPCIRLKRIFRQGEGSSIVTLAHEIQKGRLPADLKEPTADRRFFPCTKEQVVPLVIELVRQAQKRGFSLFDVQVLAPMYKGIAGVDQLNKALQKALNPPKQGKGEIAWGDGVFRSGDKVLSLTNHPEQPVYNGDIGEIVAVDPSAGEDDRQSPCLWVRFDQTEVGYTRQQLTQLSLAYCTSIHKAQGSEFAIVILPLVHTYRRMLKRNLIYTAVTRAKQYLMLLGEMRAIEDGVKEVGGFHRNSRLQERLSWE